VKFFPFAIEFDESDRN